MRHHEWHYVVHNLSQPFSFLTSWYKELEHEAKCKDCKSYKKGLENVLSNSICLRVCNKKYSVPSNNFPFLIILSKLSILRSVYLQCALILFKDAHFNIGVPPRDLWSSFCCVEIHHLYLKYMITKTFPPYWWLYLMWWRISDKDRPLFDKRCRRTCII